MQPLSSFFCAAAQGSRLAMTQHPALLHFPEKTLFLPFGCSFPTALSGGPKIGHQGLRVTPMALLHP